jgi:hypothetical protein
MFMEFKEPNTKYQVFLQAYGDGMIYVSERLENHFKVKGTPNMKFGWEVKIIQKGMSGQRFDRLPYSVVDSIEREKR